MTLATLAALAGLALVDSTSLGTLVLPLAMLAHDRLRAGRVLLYLAVIAVFYWLLGIAILLGADAALRAWRGIEDSTTTSWVLLVIGLAMLIGSFWPDTPWGKRQAARRRESPRSGVWRDRLVGDSSTPGAVIAIALAAGAVEAASMLPYLGAVGLITSSGLHPVAGGAVLAGYVVVMVLPALILLGLRIALDQRLRRALEWINTRLGRGAGDAMWWVVGIAGFFLAADSATRLHLFGT